MQAKKKQLTSEAELGTARSDLSEFIAGDAIVLAVVVAIVGLGNGENAIGDGDGRIADVDWQLHQLPSHHPLVRRSGIRLSFALHLNVAAYGLMPLMTHFDRNFILGFQVIMA